jgi:hypothetical protein
MGRGMCAGSCAPKLAGDLELSPLASALLIVLVTIPAFGMLIVVRRGGLLPGVSWWCWPGLVACPRTQGVAPRETAMLAVLCALYAPGSALLMRGAALVPARQSARYADHVQF